MNCNDVSDLISAFADNELSQEKLSILKSHTASCSDCSKYLDEVKELSGQIKQVASLSPPSSDFQARIIDSLNAQIDHVQRGRKFRRPASILFAIAASFFVSIAGALIWADLNKPSLHSASGAALGLVQIASQYDKHSKHVEVLGVHLPEKTAVPSPVDSKALSKEAGFIVASANLKGYRPALAKVISDGPDGQKFVYWCYQSTDASDAKLSCIDCYEYSDAAISLTGLSRHSTASGTFYSGNVGGKAIAVIEKAQQRKLFISNLPDKDLLQIVLEESAKQKS